MYYRDPILDDIKNIYKKPAINSEEREDFFKKLYSVCSDRLSKENMEAYLSEHYNFTIRPYDGGEQTKHTANNGEIRMGTIDVPVPNSDAVETVRVFLTQSAEGTWGLSGRADGEHHPIFNEGIISLIQFEMKLRAPDLQLKHYAKAGSAPEIDKLRTNLRKEIIRKLAKEFNYDYPFSKKTMEIDLTKIELPKVVEKIDNFKRALERQQDAIKELPRKELTSLGIAYLRGYGLSNETIDKFKDYIIDDSFVQVSKNKTKTGEYVTTQHEYAGVSFLHVDNGIINNITNHYTRGTIDIDKRQYPVNTLIKLGDDTARVKIFAENPVDGLCAYQKFKEQGLIKDPNEVQVVTGHVNNYEFTKVQINELLKKAPENAIYVIAQNNDFYTPTATFNEKDETYTARCNQRKGDTWKDSLAKAFQDNKISPKQCRKILSDINTNWKDLLQPKAEPDKSNPNEYLNNEKKKLRSKVWSDYVKNNPSKIPDAYDSKMLFEKLADVDVQIEKIRNEFKRENEKQNSERFHKREVLPSNDPYLLSRGIKADTIAQFNRNGDMRRDIAGKKYDNHLGFMVAHRNLEGDVTGYERKGPTGVIQGKSFSLFSFGGTKYSTLLMNGNNGDVEHIYVGESCVDLMSAWQYDGALPNCMLLSMYGQSSKESFDLVATRASQNPNADILICFDNDSAGQKFKDKLMNSIKEICPQKVGSSYHHKPPSEYKDWNDCILGKVTEYTGKETSVEVPETNDEDSQEHTLKM